MGNPIQVNITSPSENYVVLPNETITLTATASDTDIYIPTQQSVADTVTITWSGSGSFPNGNTGTSVQWKAPSTSGNYVITATADDTGTMHVPGGDDAPQSDNVTIRVATVQLESVTFGGSKKHTLYKKDENQWNRDNEIYATDYAKTVPNKAWVRDPALEDPLCYTRSSTGSDCTATVELSITPALGHAVSTTVKGRKIGAEDTIFSKNDSLNGSTPNVGPMNLATTFGSSISATIWYISWTINVDGENDSTIGMSINDLFITWGTPTGSTITAKRMNWAARDTCNGDSTITDMGNHIADSVNEETIFGANETDNIWEPLDGVKKHDCLRSSELAEKGLLLLGVSSSDCETQVSYASSDSTGDPDYASDVTDQEFSDSAALKFTADDGSLWNYFEGSFRAQNGSAWKYWSIFPLNGPFIGTGNDDTEKDKSARYKVLDKIRDDSGADFYQKYCGIGDEIPLP